MQLNHCEQKHFPGLLFLAWVLNACLSVCILALNKLSDLLQILLEVTMAAIEWVYHTDSLTDVIVHLGQEECLQAVSIDECHRSLD